MRQSAMPVPERRVQLKADGVDGWPVGDASDDFADSAAQSAESA